MRRPAYIGAQLPLGDVGLALLKVFVGLGVLFLITLGTWMASLYMTGWADRGQTDMVTYFVIARIGIGVLAAAIFTAISINAIHELDNPL